MLVPGRNSTNSDNTTTKERYERKRDSRETQQYYPGGIMEREIESESKVN